MRQGGGGSPNRRGSSWLGRGSPTGRRPTLSLPSAEAPTFLLRRRRKELEARRRAETKHEELVGMLLIRATEVSHQLPQHSPAASPLRRPSPRTPRRGQDYRFVGRVDDLSKLAKDLKRRGGMTAAR